MQRITYLAFFLSFIFCGCTNSIYYYQTDGLSLKLKGKIADASQPIEGVLGFKERVAIVTPPKNDGEAASLLSGFSFSKGQGFFGNVNIRSALVTGESANNFAAGATNSVDSEITKRSNSDAEETGRLIADKVVGLDINSDDDNAKLYFDKATPKAKDQLKKFFIYNNNQCPENPEEDFKKWFESLDSISTYTKQYCESLKNAVDNQKN